VLRPASRKDGDSKEKARGVTRKPAADEKSCTSEKIDLEFPKQFMLDALEQSIDDGGWAQLATFGSYLNKLQSDFDSRNYGYKKLSDLVRAKTDLFVTEKRSTPNSSQKQLCVRAK
jgi:hypothetical protein